MENVDKKILNRIKKLINHANSAQELGSEKEAFEFMTKAKQMLFENNLSIDNIDFSDPQNKIGDKFILDFCSEKSGYGKWKNNLIHLICDNFLCSVYYFGKKSHSVKIIGTEQNIDICVYLFNFIETQVRSFAKPAYKKYVESCREKYCIWADDEKEAQTRFRAMYNVFIPKDQFIRIDKNENATNGIFCYSVKELWRYGLQSYTKDFYKSYYQGMIRGLKEAFYQKKLNKKQDALVLSNKVALEEYAASIFKKINEKDFRPKKVDRDGLKFGLKDSEKISLNMGISQAKRDSKKLLN